MRITYLLLSLVLCLCPVMQAQNTTNQFMKQAQSSLEKKDYTKARYLFLQAYKSLSQQGDYKQAIDARYAGGLSILLRELLPRGIRSLPPDEPIHLNRGTEVAKIAL